MDERLRSVSDYQFQNQLASLRLENEQLRTRNLELEEARSMAEMYRKQLQEMRKSRQDPDFSTPVASREQLRSEALSSRLKEIQNENQELRRRLAGLTPDTPRHVAQYSRECPGCTDLNKRKLLQANYLTDKVLDAKRTANEYRQHCEKLQTEVKGLNAMLNDIHKKYQGEIDKLSQHAKVYKSRSERVERWNKASLRGFQADIKLIKDKLAKVEKEIVQTQLLCSSLKD